MARLLGETADEADAGRRGADAGIVSDTHAPCDRGAWDDA
jgi:hypothetical protein